MNELSWNDVERLLADPSAATRAGVAEKLGAGYVDGAYGDRERDIADDVLRAIARDVEMEVRAALSRAICTARDVPADVAQRLAQDVAAVAVPMLSVSELLSDEDLAGIIQTRTAAHRLAIAGREQVGPAASEALVESGDVPAVAKLVANPGAELDEPAIGRVVDRYADELSVTTPLAERPTLPLAAAERLVTLVSERLRAHFAASGEGSEADRLLAGSGVRAALLLSNAADEARDVYALAEQLDEIDKLSSRLLLESLCAGDRTFFEAAVARRAKVSLAHAGSMLTEEASRVSLLTRAGLSENDVDLARNALRSLEDLEATHPDCPDATLRELLAERIATRMEERLTTDQRAMLVRVARG